MRTGSGWPQRAGFVASDATDTAGAAAAQRRQLIDVQPDGAPSYQTPSPGSTRPSAT